VALLATTPYLFLAKNAVPADDLKGFIAWVKANPDKVTQGIVNVGGPEHVGGILLQKEIGTRFGFVPYRGGAPALQDLVAGQIDMVLGEEWDPERPDGRIEKQAAPSSLLAGNCGCNEFRLHQRARPDLLQIAANYAVALGDPS
jgi:hypothetical protein